MMSGTNNDLLATSSKVSLFSILKRLILSPTLSFLLNLLTPILKIVYLLLWHNFITLDLLCIFCMKFI